MKDWTGNKAAVYATHGASNHSRTEREISDFYATPPEAVIKLLERESFDPYIWEPACGAGHISMVLEDYGYKVYSTDLIDRGYGTGGIDFLSSNEVFSGSIITNPPYSFAKEFVEKAMESIQYGHKVAMFLKLTFLEGVQRLEMFKKYPPEKIYVFSRRVNCGKNGDFSGVQSAVAYAWFIWRLGFNGSPTISWID